MYGPEKKELTPPSTEGKSRTGIRSSTVTKTTSPFFVWLRSVSSQVRRTHTRAYGLVFRPVRDLLILSDGHWKASWGVMGVVSDGPLTTTRKQGPTNLDSVCLPHVEGRRRATFGPLSRPSRGCLRDRSLSASVRRTPGEEVPSPLERLLFLGTVTFGLVTIHYRIHETCVIM